MATNGDAAPKAAGSSTQAAAANGNGTPTQSKSGLVPTNNVTIKDGVTVRTRIEPTLPVDDVIRQLCVNLQIQERPTMFALRDEKVVGLSGGWWTAVFVLLAVVAAFPYAETADLLRMSRGRLGATLRIREQP